MHKSNRAVYLDSNLAEVSAGSPYAVHLLVAEGESLPNVIARRYGLLKSAGDEADDEAVRVHLFPIPEAPPEVSAPEVATAEPSTAPPEEPSLKKPQGGGGNG